MTRPSLPPGLSGSLYLAAGVLFLVGAIASRQIGFSIVGIAFVGLGIAMIARDRRA